MEERAIIAQTLPPRDWDSASADIITDPAELFRLLALDPATLPASLAAAKDFPLKVPRSYARLIQTGSPDDPLLHQILARGEELEAVPGYGLDPLDEAEHTPVPGILHKYQGRVLLMVTGACAVHCRYCFRRHFPYQDHLPTPDRLEAALEWLQQRPDIHEVILSGGDPFSVSDRRLNALLQRLAALPHVRRLRIHSRLPVVMPERVSEGLLAMLEAFPRKVVLVIHANHARELSPDVALALSSFKAVGVQLLNQSVLLRGVNDDVGTLVALSERLFELDVQPYYLHQLDKVAGAAHFAVTDSSALALLKAMAAQLPGYLMPRLVREESGSPGKTPLR